MEPFRTYVMDFEGSLATGVLEYGWVGVDSVKGIFTTETGFCKNRAEIPSSESALHQIHTQQLSQCSDFTTILPHLLTLRSQSYFCAHNAVFEHTLLQDYTPVVLQAYSVTEHAEPSWGPWLDTCVLYKKHFKKIQGNRRCCAAPSITLQALVEFCGLQKILEPIGAKFCPISRQHYHCALWDALACALLLLHFLRLEDIQSKTFRWLLQESCSQTKAQAFCQPLLPLDTPTLET